MEPVAVLVGQAPVRLWGLSGRERLRRVLGKRGIPVLAQDEAIPGKRSVLCLRADCLFDERVIGALIDAPGR